MKLFRKLVEEDLLQTVKGGEAQDPPTGCRWYREDGFCMVVGSICPHYQITYKECEVRRYATASNMQPLILPKVSGKEIES